MIGLLILSLLPEECFQLAQWKGIELIQISLENQFDTISSSLVQELASACSENGKRLAFHAPSADLMLGSKNDGIRLESIRQIEAAIRIVGPFAQFITIHTGYTPLFAQRGSLERCISSIRALSTIASDFDTVLSIENVQEETIEHILDYFRLSEPCNLKFTFDIAHSLLYSKMTIETVFHVLSDKLSDIHLSQPSQTRDSHFALTGQWDPLDRVISAASESRYNGAFTIEVRNLRDAKLSLDIMQQKLATSRKSFKRSPL